MDRFPRASAALAILALILGGCGVEGPIPSATGSAVASASPASAAPSTTASAFAADAGRLRGHLEQLQAIADAHGGIRAAGTSGYDASVDYAAAALVEIGFSVDTPELTYTGFRELPGAQLTVGERAFQAPDELHALIYSAGGDVRGPVVELEESGCDPEHFEGIGPGAVVLTVAGGCLRRDQAVNAAQAGAAALVVGYPGRGPGEIYRPTLLDPGGIEIPVVSVTDEAIDAIRAHDGDVHLAVQTEREPATTRNVVAQLGDGPLVVMLGGHLDSVFEGAGINDNGSGVAALLEIARGVAVVGVPDGITLRIGLWGAEELGSVGSSAYVENLGDELVAYLNLDMAGSPNGSNLVYAEDGAAEGSDVITEAYEAWFAERGLPTQRVDLGGGSDHRPFTLAGIPTGGLFAGAGPTGSAASPGGSPDPAVEPPDACYHLACDDLDNVDLARVATFADATMAVALQLVGS